MKYYRLEQSQFEVDKRYITRLYAGMIILLSVGSLVVTLFQKLPVTSLWWLPIVDGLLVYYMFNAFKKRQAFFREYSLGIDKTHLVQNQPELPELELKASSLWSLEEDKKGLMLSTQTHRNILTIPNAFSKEDHKEIVEILQGWVARNRGTSL